MTNQGKLLKLARTRKGLSQTELAKKINYSGMFVSHCEHGKARIPIAKIKKICQVLNLPVELMTSAVVRDFKQKLKRQLEK